MDDPISYPSRTQTLGLPLFFAGQAQKEFLVNEAMSLLDALLWRVVEAALEVPPADAPDGFCYRVLDQAAGEWSGKDGSLAVRIGGAWHFITPHSGMQVFDRTQQCWYHFDGDWACANHLAIPQGGTVVDVEARATIVSLIDALRRIGMLPPQTS